MEVERLTAVLEASGLAGFQANMAAADRYVESTKGNLGGLAEISRIATGALQHVKMTATQALESEAAANRIKSSVSAVSRTAMEAADHLERVKMKSQQAAETTVVADQIDRKLHDITGNANEARRALESVLLAGIAAGRGGGGGPPLNTRNPGAGFGPFGSGYGRVGVLGAAIGAGVLTGPAIAPAAIGLLSAIPGLAASGVGALGTLLLAFNGVGKAIGGDKKAFDELTSSQQAFVLQVRSLHGWLQGLKQVAGEAMFPGLTQGLHDALSPSTLNAISAALHDFGGAIGQAGAMWGKYFGSAEFVSKFGPLMHEGAQMFTTMSGAALSLFDALGVLGVAAIPLVSWLTNAAAAGARWLDTWLKGKTATGELSGAMREAQSSLTLVGKLIESLWHAVMALGTALYPVSKVAVKDLINGLNGLADIIRRNQDAIREVVGTALTGLVTAIKIVVGGLSLLTAGLSHLIGMKAPVVTAILAIGAALALTLGPQAAVVLGVILAVGYIKNHWQQLEAFFKELWRNIKAIFYFAWDELKIGAALAVLKIIEPFSHLPGWMGDWARKMKDRLHEQLDAMRLDAAQQGQNIGWAIGSSTYNGVLPWLEKTQEAIRAAWSTWQGGSVPTGMKPPNTKGIPGIIGLTGPQLPHVFNGSIKGESSTMIAALEGISRYYKNAEINVISGYRSTAKQQRLWDAAVRAGHPGRMPNGNPIAQPGTSPHESGNALDGTISIGGRNVPLSSLPPSVLARFGLESVAGDVNHVQLAGTTPAVTSAFGALPAWTKNLGPRPTPPPLIPVNLTNAASKYANLASNLGNTGAAAKKYLEQELTVLTKEYFGLKAKLDDASGKNKDAIKKAMTGVENNMRDTGRLIRDAVVVTGDALIPKGLKTKLAAIQGQYSADVAFAAILVGSAADTYAVTIRHNLNQQASVLQQEVDALKRKLAGAAGKQRTAIQDEISAVSKELADVQQGILQSLQGAVQTLQTRVGNLFGKVQQQFAAAFEQQTQSMVDDLGAKFFQNGLMTPLEGQLAGMQASDRLQSLQDALTGARDQLAKDQNTLAAVVYEATTGITSYLYDSESLKQVEADNKAIAAAQRALDENDIAIRAAAERSQADRDYTSQLKQLQQTRTTLENAMNDQLAKLSEQLQNGTGSMQALSAIAAYYGIQISSTTIPDFDDLSTASGKLIDAITALAAYIEKITGYSPNPAPTGGDGSGADGGGSSSAALDYRDAAQAAAEALGYYVTYTLSGGGVYYQSNSGNWGKKPMLDEGGWVEKTGVAVVHAGETYSGVGAKRLGGSSMTVELTVNALDPESVDWDGVAVRVRDAFGRMARSGTPNPWD